MIRATWVRRSVVWGLGAALCCGSLGIAMAEGGHGRCAASPAAAAAQMEMTIVGEGVAVYRGVRLVQSQDNPLLWLVPGAELARRPLAPAAGTALAVERSAATRPVLASSQECGRFEGIEYLFCCEDKFVGSAIVVPDPAGNARAIPATASCGPTGGSCSYYEVGPCS